MVQNYLLVSSNGKTSSRPIDSMIFKAWQTKGLPAILAIFLDNMLIYKYRVGVYSIVDPDVHWQELFTQRVETRKKNKKLDWDKRTHVLRGTSTWNKKLRY